MQWRHDRLEDEPGIDAAAKLAAGNGAVDHHAGEVVTGPPEDASCLREFRILALERRGLEQRPAQRGPVVVGDSAGEDDQIFSQRARVGDRKMLCAVVEQRVADEILPRPPPPADRRFVYSRSIRDCRRP